MPFFVKYIKLKSPSPLQRLTGRYWKLIDTVGKDGDFIMANGAFFDEAKPENVKAMVDFTKEYGVYGRV